ncbi:MAG: glycosyltransferase [Candidatus Obscuribacterales bacterium]|nr:glycosyltransferase [Candidatus Obscuribacterales bacterium]
MRICLLTNEFPADSLSDAESDYISELARGLDGLGHEVTVICARSKNADIKGKIRVIVAAPSKRIADLRLVRRTMPKSVGHACELLGFWQAFCQTGAEFDVVEAPETLAGALLTAFSRETPTVMRITGRKDAESGEQMKNFDDQFANLICDFAYASVDLFSCASSAGSEYVRQVRGFDARQVVINAAEKECDIATTAANIYATAIERFAGVRKPHLYRHGAQRLIKSTEDMIVLYDRMLYDLLFRVSYTFRIGHWFRKLLNNPEAFKTRLFARFSQRV